MYDFFIAYATPDRQQAQSLCWFLQDDACKVFLDVQDLGPGASWGPALREALEASRAIVVLVSTHADDAFYQQEEIGRAIQLARDMPQAHTVIPIILEKLPRGAGSMPYGMSSLQAKDATRSGGLKRVAAELVAWLKEHQLNAKQPKVADAAIEAEIPKPIRDTRKDDVRTSVARIGINQDASRTYFYVPDGDSNRYPNLYEYEHHSYSIFSFELDISANGIRIHEIRAFVYHPSFQKWTELEDAITYLPRSRLPDTMEYLERHMKVHSAFASINIQNYPVVISFAKYGAHYESLEHGYGYRLPVALVLHVNTSYLYLFLEVPEMGIGQAFILDYKIFDSFGIEMLEQWVIQPGWDLESRQRRRVIEISEAMP